MSRAVPYNRWLWPGIVVWLVINGLILGTGAWWAYENELFADHAAHIDGTVTRKFVNVSHGRGGTHFSHCVIYTYRAGALVGSRQTVVHGYVWETFLEGGPIPVKYLPENPQHSRIDEPAEDYSATMKARLGLGCGGVFLLLGAAVSYYAIRRNRLHRRLVAAGDSCVGTITSVEVENSGKQLRTYLHLEFRDNYNRLIEGRTWDLPQPEERKWQSGKAVRVYFDPANSSIFTVDLTRTA